MNKLLRFYNQNRGIIWIVIFGIILVIALVNTLNSIAKESSKKRAEQVKEILLGTKESNYRENPDISITISDEKVSEQKNLIIDQFIRYCNAGQIQDAYALLSNNCRNNLYPTLDSFRSDYINNIFTTVKLYKKENYKENTYKVNLYEDVAETGRLDTSSIEEYYTIIAENGENKLNIHNYIGNKIVNKKNSTKNIQIEIKEKNIYKNYEEYTLEVKNLTNNEIKLDSLESTKKIYLTNSKDLKYYCLLNENTDNDITILPNSTKKIKLKFNIEYNNNNIINRMIISDIILNNKEYSNITNKTNYKDREKVIVEI